MRKTVFVVMSVLFVLVAAFVILVMFTINRSKDCASFVIDSTEITTGLDIPEVDQYFCFQDKVNDIRVGVYRLDQELVNIDNYIKTYNLCSTSNLAHELLWTKDLLIEESAPIPHESGDFYFISGNHEKARWQCLLDRSSARIWFEIDWK